ncbi:MAG: DUF2304 domain-containing protein [Candidatus Gracilibacteria bacterium]|nr:DUF2304 domain-containing protein [Candidatus Gracilibacteria bacterium]
MSIYQFLVPVLAMIMIVIGASRYQRREQTLREFILWVLVWLGLSLISIFPHEVIKFIEKVTGIKSGINALLFFAIVVLLYAVLRLFIRLERVEQDVTKIVRKDALDRFRKNTRQNHDLQD